MFVNTNVINFSSLTVNDGELHKTYDDILTEIGANQSRWCNESFKLQLSGAWQPTGICRFKKLLKKEVSQMFFFLWRLHNAVEMVVVRKRLNFSESYVMDSTSRAGGLALFWNDNVEINILSASLHHIDYSVKDLFC